MLDESQLTEGLGHPDTVEGGTVITSAMGTRPGQRRGRPVDSASDVQSSTGFGQIMVDDGTTVQAYMDPDGDFGSSSRAPVTTSDRPDGVSEVFNPAPEATGNRDTAGTLISSTTPDERGLWLPRGVAQLT